MTIKLHRPVIRLFSELQHYQDFGAASADAVIRDARHESGWMAKAMIRVAFHRRRPWAERVATRYIGFIEFTRPQHSPESFARIVSLCQNVR